MGTPIFVLFFFFFNDTATTEIYTLSLHDALPIFPPPRRPAFQGLRRVSWTGWEDRKSTRLNSSHDQISYAVFCLKKKKNVTLHHHLASLAQTPVKQINVHPPL